jgi:hypothetical protein
MTRKVSSVGEGNTTIGCGRRHALGFFRFPRTLGRNGKDKAGAGGASILLRDMAVCPACHPLSEDVRNTTTGSENLAGELRFLGTETRQEQKSIG